MIFVGIDDTDIEDSPGTNQLCRHLISLVKEIAHVRRIVRHQLLDDPRVPYTSQNGSASIWLTPRSSISCEELANRLIPAIVDWSPAGSDPGICLAEENVPSLVRQFGQECQQALQHQQRAFEIAASAGLFLKGLGGTNDGVIGALAAVGLAADGNDGRVVYLDQEEKLPPTGTERTVSELYQAGVEEILCYSTGERIERGLVDVGKKLRPNLSRGNVVLFVEPAEANEAEPPRWKALKLR